MYGTAFYPIPQKIPSIRSPESRYPKGCLDECFPTGFAACFSRLKLAASRSFLWRFVPKHDGRKNKLEISHSWLEVFLYTHSPKRLCVDGKINSLPRFHRLLSPQGGYCGFQVTVMTEWGQKSNPKKMPGPTINPQKNHMPNLRALKIYLQN